MLAAVASDPTERERRLEAKRRTLESTLPFFCSWWAPLSFVAFSVAVVAVFELRLAARPSLTANVVGFVVLVALSVAYMALLRLVARKVGISLSVEERHRT